MKLMTNVIGVDVASRKLDLFDNRTNQHLTIENEGGQIASYVKKIRRRKSTLVVMEATGGYETQLVETLQSNNIPCAVVNPLQMRQFAKGCGMLEKNDKIDAKMITRFGEVVQPLPKEKLSENHKELRSLVHRRSQILSQMLAEQKRVYQSTNPNVVKQLKQAIDFYKSQLKEIEASIQELIDTDTKFRETAEILMTCPGVGKITVAVLLSELPELGQLNRGQIAKLVGVAPIVNESGESQRKRSTTAGRGQVRRTLYMAALSATRHNERLRAFYQRLLSRGKPKKVALVAVMRKLIVTLNTMTKNHEKWRENHRETPLAVDKN